MLLSQKNNHLFWGLSLFSCGAVLMSTMTSLMRTTTTLQLSQTNALACLSESVLLFLLAPIAKKNWSLKTVMEWGSFVLLGCGGGANYIFHIYCSPKMPLGDFAAFNVAGILATPILVVIFYQRCPSLIDAISLMFAGVGILLVTQPTFIFGSLSVSSLTPSTTLAASFTGLFSCIYPFVIAHFPHVHWSNYILIRNVVSGVVALPLIAAMGAWSLPASSAMASSSEIGVAVVVSLFLGIVINIVRTACILGCQELEAFGVGTAGVVTNIVNACNIPAAALFAVWFFDELVSPLEALGCALTFLAIVASSAWKFWRGANDDEDDVDLEEKSKLCENKD